MSESATSLAAFLRRNQEKILAEWAMALRREPRAADLPRPVLLDHVPEILARIADLVETASSGMPAPTLEAARHVRARLEIGFDLEQVVQEYAILRDCIVRLWEEADGHRTSLSALRVLNQVVDRAIATSVDRYVVARSRTMEAIDRVSEAALSVSSVEVLLDRLLSVFTKTTASADGAAILLQEDDVLRVKAAVGACESWQGQSLTLGAGLCGMIAAQRRPVSMRNGVVPEGETFLPALGVTAFFGAPLIRGDEVIGVAAMISRSAPQFSDEDERLFEAMWTRAAIAIEEQLLRDETHALAGVLELGDACLLLESNGRVRFMNRSQEVLSGRRSSELLGRVLWEVNPPVAAAGSTYWDELHRAQSEGVAVRFEEHDPSTHRWLEVSAYPSPSGGLAVFSRDVTARKQLEEARQRFVGILGHDLRNPLNAVSMMSRLLIEREDPSSDTSEWLHRIVAASERMAGIISNVTDWTRSRVAGGIPISPGPMDLREVCARVIDEFTASNPEREIRLVAEGSTEGSWDAARIAQALSNLIANAIQHGAADRPIQIRIASDSEQAILSIHNEGDPIPPDLLARLFEPFIHDSTPPNPSSRENLGLGLYITHEIVRAHAGTITVSSSAEATRFEIRLPR